MKPEIERFKVVRHIHLDLMAADVAAALQGASCVDLVWDGEAVWLDVGNGRHFKTPLTERILTALERRRDIVSVIDVIPTDLCESDVSSSLPNSTSSTFSSWPK